MHDARTLLDPGTDAVRRLARRGHALDAPALEDLLARRNKSIRQTDELRAESKRVAQEVGASARQGGDVTALKERARELKDQIRDVEAEQERLAEELHALLLTIPNLPLDAVPDGDSEADAVEVHRWGSPGSRSRAAPARRWSAGSRRSSWTSTRGGTGTPSSRCRSS